MKLKTLPKEIACELLVYMSEKETFTNTCETLGRDITPNKIKSLLREMAVELQKEASTEKASPYSVEKCKHLTEDSKKIISFLSPTEEKNLLKAFGLIEEK